MCSRCCQLLCYRLTRWFCVYSHSESTKTALECVLRCDYSGKKTDKFSKRGFKIWKIFLFPYKDRLKRSQRSKVVYKAVCWNCDEFYIGKTKRRLHYRKTEHFKALAKSDHSSAIADHVITTGHDIKWDHFDISASGKTDFHCKIKETSQKDKNDRIPFTLTFHPHNHAVKSIILSNFKLLQNDPETGRIFSQPPLISFKRDKNVGNFLVRSAKRQVL